MSERCVRTWISVTQGMSGYFAVLLGEFVSSKGYKYIDCIQTGIGRYKTAKEAEIEARDWAALEEIKLEVD